MSDEKSRPFQYSGNARGLGKHEQEIQDNYTMMQGFEWFQESGGKYYKQMIDKAQSIGEMGITAVWIPPSCKASSQEGNGYDIYDIWDLGEFEKPGDKGVSTKFGTKQQLVELISKLKQNGVVAYLDVVANHKAGADFKETFHATMVDQNDRNKEVSDMLEIEGWTGFNFPGRNKKYSEMEWHHYHFTGVDWDAKTETKAIYKIQGEGKQWADKVDKEKGSFDYLMFADIDHSHPEVRDEWFKWGEWVLKETGAVGFRFDAVKHIDRDFIRDFVRETRKRVDNPDLFAVGEAWKDDFDFLNGYLDGIEEQFSVFDTPLHYNFKQFSDSGENFDLRQIFDGSIVQNRPTDAVTLVDNHDTQPGEALESWVAPIWKPLCYGLILWRNDGYPCVFAGDLFGSEPNSPHPFEKISQLDDFIKIRKNFTYGPTNDYWDHPNCIGWTRLGDPVHTNGCAIVMCNGSEPGTKRMQVNPEAKGQTWTDILGWHQGEVVIGDDGWAEFSCSERSVSVWVNKEAKEREQFNK
ncbi:hypothetical protein OIO90_003547 [Microbotryomycetes sp. JL221]|nr:hypothetical protein OIO90_003547 [Microbotryomycetes sp. JL221]